MEIVVMSRWLFTEAQTEKTRLDTQYSFLNKIFQAYVEDDNEILIEDDIMRAKSFNEGIYGNTAVLVDAANIFGTTAIMVATSSLLFEDTYSLTFFKSLKK